MLIPYGKQKIEDQDIQAVVRVLESDYLTQGPTVAEFETAFSIKLGAKFAVSFCNATAALHTCVKILKRDSSKKVLVTPITFAASANCVLYEGGQVEFVDINPANFNIDIALLEETLSKNPERYQGIIPVDFAGLPVDMEKVSNVAKKYNLWIIEDGCHSIGGEFRNSAGEWVKVGSGKYSDFTVFSFHPVKHIATGEGGMVTTNSEEFYHRLIKLRSHGIERDHLRFVSPSQGGWYHEMQELGFNYRMSDINAALGLSQLRRLEDNIQKRNKIAQKYQTFFKKWDCQFQDFDSGKFRHAYHLFVIQQKHRRQLYDFLKEKSIFTQVHYIPVYKHPYYQNLGFSSVHLASAENYYQKALSLPMYHSLTEDQLDYVLAKFIEFWNQ